MSPTRSSSSRPLMNRKLCRLLKTARLPKSTITSNLCPTTSHCCLPLKILLKAVLRLKKQTWTTNKFVRSWHHQYLPEREASAERSQVYHPERECLMSSASQSLNFIGAGKPVALFSHQRRLSQDAFSERERERPVDVLGNNESIFSECCEISS